MEIHCWLLFNDLPEALVSLVGLEVELKSPCS